MPVTDYLPARTILNRRLQLVKSGLVDIRSTLHHFALINYALPKSRLTPFIPADRFSIPEFDINGRLQALMSAVPFLDVDFRFVHLAPFLKFVFPQTNYRVYVIDRQTGEHVVWFFGTTLGSHLVRLARGWWRIPWHYARYEVDCLYDARLGQYGRFHYVTRSTWGSAVIDLLDSGQPAPLQAGFTSADEMALILTHPLQGFYYRLDGRLGTYRVWHDVIPVTVARPHYLFFGLYERLGLLSREEMMNPHSIFICPRVAFDIHLPPQVVGN